MNPIQHLLKDAVTLLLRAKPYVVGKLGDDRYCDEAAAIRHDIMEFVQYARAEPDPDAWKAIEFNEDSILGWPPRDKPVLVLHKDGTMFEAVICHDAGIDTPNAREPAYDYWYDPHRDDVLDDDTITHWRELPIKPSTEQNPAT